MEEQKNDSKILERYAIKLLTAGIFVIVIVLLIVAVRALFVSSLESTGQFGDAMGGITAPFLNLIGAGLVFLALRSTVHSNGLAQQQIKDANKEKILAAEAENLKQLYEHLDDNIKAFTFMSFPKRYLRNTEGLILNKSFKGGEAFEQFFSLIRCHYHGSQEYLDENQSVAEVVSILTIMDLLLQRLLSSECRNREILLTLVKHQFLYKMSTNIKSLDVEELKIYMCHDCNCNHGLPEHIRVLIKNIKKNLENVA